MRVCGGRAVTSSSSCLAQRGDPSLRLRPLWRRRWWRHQPRVAHRPASRLGPPCGVGNRDWFGRGDAKGGGRVTPPARACSCCSSRAHPHAAAAPQRTPFARASRRRAPGAARGFGAGGRPRALVQLAAGRAGNGGDGRRRHHPLVGAVAAQLRVVAVARGLERVAFPCKEREQSLGATAGCGAARPSLDAAAAASTTDAHKPPHLLYATPIPKPLSRTHTSVGIPYKEERDTPIAHSAPRIQFSFGARQGEAAPPHLPWIAHARAR